MLSYLITYSFYNLDLNSLYFLWIYISYYGKLISFSFCPWSKYRWWVRLTRCRERFSSIYGLFIEKHGKSSLYHAIFCVWLGAKILNERVSFTPSLTCSRHKDFFVCLISFKISYIQLSLRYNKCVHAKLINV